MVNGSNKVGSRSLEYAVLYALSPTLYAFEGFVENFQQDGSLSSLFTTLQQKGA